MNEVENKNNPKLIYIKHMTFSIQACRSLGEYLVVSWYTDHVYYVKCEVISPSWAAFVFWQQSEIALPVVWQGE